jgi:hypothetical protein
MSLAAEMTPQMAKLFKENRELRAALAVAVELIDRLAESGPCYLTDDGFCMAHDGVAAPCPHPLGRQVVESWRAVEDEAAKR